MVAGTGACVAVLGAGPAGLGAAFLLAQRGISVILLEKLDRVGGNAGSFELAGIPVDFGSHRFHPASDPAILAMIRGLLGDDLLERPRHGRIRLMDRWLHFPLNAQDLLLNMPPKFVLGVAADLLTKLWPQNKEETRTFASVLRHGLGSTICQAFYFPYARKIWGMEPVELSPIQAQKRVSSGSIAKILRKLLPAGTGKAGAGSKGVFYYPKGGFGQISEALCTAASNAGADIRLGSEVRHLALGSDRHCVVYEHHGESHTADVQHIWSTIPVTLLARFIEPLAPEAVVAAARSLRFRSMLLVYLVLDTNQFTAFDAHYLPERDFHITRLSEPKNYSARDEPQGITALCAELPCQRDDEVWRLGDTALGQLVLEDLAKAGIPVDCQVKQVVVKRLPHAYPLYPLGFEQAFNLLDFWVEGLSNVLSFGRQGLYAHDNTHHALYMASAAVRCLGSDGAFDRDQWAREREVFATHVVED